MKAMRINTSLSALAVAVASVFQAPVVIGETTDNRRQLEEVVVTAQKRSESLQDVPVAVSAFTGDSLNDYGVSGFKSLQLVTPSLVFNNTGPSASAYLRGIGTRFSITGLEPSIATYMDDRYVSRGSATLAEFADVERLEVLKGPQGTLYGRNATGGALRIITKDPYDEFEGDVKLSAGNEDYFSGSFTTSIPLNDDLSVRISGLKQSRDGFVKNIFAGGPSEIDDLDFESIRGKMLWNVSDDSELRISLDHWSRDDTSGSEAQVLPPRQADQGVALAGGITGTKSDEVATASPSSIDARSNSAQLRYDLSLDWAEFATITTYSDYQSDRFTDADGSSAKRLDGDTEENAETYSQEFQLVSNANDQFEWILGFYYFQEEGSTLIDLDATDLAGAIFSLGRQNVETTAWSIYGQGTYHLNDNWSLTLGGRWNDEEKEVQQQSGGPGVVDTIVTPFEDKDDWNSFTPKVTLEYKNDLGLVYLTYSRGFKSGGFAYPASGKEPLDPEILDMIEFGVKADLFDNQVRLNAAAFYYDYEDLQVTRAAGGSGGVTLTTENAANAEVLGLEMDVTWLATEYLTVTTGFSILESEYSDYDASAKVFNTSGIGTTDIAFDADGEELLRAPKTSAFLSLNYAVPLKDASLPIAVTYSYKGEYDFDFIASSETESLRQDAYELVNARITYQPDHEKWSVSLWGNNLTDEVYFDDLVANASGIRGSYAAPRTYGIDLNYSF